MPRLLDVKGFDGILIDTGNTAKSSAGFLTVGRNTLKAQVTESKDCWEYLMEHYLIPSKNDLSIEIVKKY